MSVFGGSESNIKDFGQHLLRGEKLQFFKNNLQSWILGVPPPSTREVRHSDAGKNSPTRTRNGGFANIGNTNTPGLPGILGILDTWVTRYLTI